MANKLIDPAEFEHVVELLRADFAALPDTKEHLNNLVGLLIEDACIDLTGEKFEGWDLSDVGDLHRLRHEIRVPGPGEVFPRCYLNSLEDAAANWLSALIAARFSLAWDGMTEEDLDAINERGKVALIERLNASVLSMEPDAELGKKRRNEQRDFVERFNAERRSEREIEWLRWNQEAIKLKKKNPSLSKIEIARRIKTSLRLSENPGAIARRLK